MNPSSTEPSKYTIFSYIRAGVTYASVVGFVATFIVGLPLAWFGVGINEQWIRWSLYVIVVPLAALIWLVNEYRVAKHRIAIDGSVQSPEWLWTFITNRLTHSRHHIPPGAQVMVFVPPGSGNQAEKLRANGNVCSESNVYEGQYNLLFHYVPESVADKIDEDQGHSEPNGPIRTLEDLTVDLTKCEAIALFDDGEWQRKYQRTLRVVQDWSIKHTERPIVSLHLNGSGRLIYNWCFAETVLGENKQGLYSRLLKQANDRGYQWYRQAQLYRWFVLRAVCVLLVVSLAAVFLAYSFWNRGVTYKTELDIQTAKLNELTYVGGNGSEQVMAAKTLSTFRSSSKPADGKALEKLLIDSAGYIKALVERNSKKSDISISLFMAAVDDKSFVRIREVAASRPKFRRSPYVFDTDLADPEQKSIVGCAIVQGAFVFWSGDTSSKTTNHIWGRDIRGNEVGKYNEQTHKLEAVRHSCSYQFEWDMGPQEIVQKPEERDVPQRRLLCAPAGSTYNFHEPGNGAICISSPSDDDFLFEPWVRFTLLRFGNALSFSSWEPILSQASDEKR